MNESPSALAAHPAASVVLCDLGRALGATLRDGLLGLYVVGSLAAGDFDDRVSDIDVVALTGSAINEDQLTALNERHLALVREHSDWDDRIEVVFVTRGALATRGAAAYPTAVVSPGEPLHLLPEPPDDDEWLVNWYALRERAFTIYGMT